MRDKTTYTTTRTLHKTPDKTTYTNLSPPININSTKLMQPHHQEANHDTAVARQSAFAQVPAGTTLKPTGHCHRFPS